MGQLLLHAVEGGHGDLQVLVLPGALVQGVRLGALLVGLRDPLQGLAQGVQELLAALLEAVQLHLLVLDLADVAVQLLLQLGLLPLVLEVLALQEQHLAVARLLSGVGLVDLLPRALLAVALGPREIEPLLLDHAMHVALVLLAVLLHAPPRVAPPLVLAAPHVLVAAVEKVLEELAAPLVLPPHILELLLELAL